MLVGAFELHPSRRPRFSSCSPYIPASSKASIKLCQQRQKENGARQWCCQHKLTVPMVMGMSVTCSCTTINRSAALAADKQPRGKRCAGILSSSCLSRYSPSSSRYSYCLALHRVGGLSKLLAHERTSPVYQRPTADVRRWIIAKPRLRQAAWTLGWARIARVDDGTMPNFWSERSCMRDRLPDMASGQIAKLLVAQS